MSDIAGIVLCGGHSTRMGRPKAWLPFGDELMLPRVVRLLGEVVSPIVVVAAAGQDLPPLPADVIVVRDPQPGLGPMQGLAAGLAMAKNGPHAAHAAYVSSCDVPLLKPAFVRRMFELLGDADACVPRIGEQIHPLAAVYRTEVAAVAERQLAAGNLRLTNLCAVLKTRFVTASELAAADPGFSSLRNVNTPADLAAAVADARL
jgi:molybdopterin-guanine dinucleotide biosynthesis protein A